MPTLTPSKNSKPNFACFLTVRTGSTRLPQKTLLSIRGKRLIEHVIDRMKLLKEVDQIILCTSIEPDDNILETIARENGVKVFRGSLHDKIARWLGAVDQFGVDYFVNVDAADDIFCDPELIDLALQQTKSGGYDYLEIPDSIVCGGAARCISSTALREVYKIKDTDEIEDYRPYFTETGLFKVGYLSVTDPIFHNSQVRLTLDYKEDYDFFSRVFDELSINKNTVPLREIMHLLERKPNLNDINFFRHKEFWVKIEKNKKLIIKGDAVSSDVR